MKWIVYSVLIIIFLSAVVLGQPVQYSTMASSGAPAPAYPTSPESLKLQVPSAVIAWDYVPTVGERSQNLVMADQRSAYESPVAVGTRATADSPIYNQIVLPPKGYVTPNELFISNAPRTMVGCNLYANLPIWMNISSRGTTWFYEWYPNGQLEVQYLGAIYYQGWYKRWFFADFPGWHILQYYCNGWSNYAYVYVNGPSGYWVDRNPNPTTSISIITEVITEPSIAQKPSILPIGPTQKPSILPTGPTQKPSVLPTGPTQRPSITTTKPFQEPSITTTAPISAKPSIAKPSARPSRIR